MLNFRKLKKDYSPVVLKEGRQLFDKGMVLSTKVSVLTPKTIRLICRVQGSFENTYQCVIEIDRKESMTLDSDCGCSHKYDCQHLSAVLFHLEERWDEVLVNYSQENKVDEFPHLDDDSKLTIRETLKAAQDKETERLGKKQLKELLQEYINSAKILAKSPYFVPEENLQKDQAELEVILLPPPQSHQPFDIQLALRLPFRSKPLLITNVKEFLESVKYKEPIYIGAKRYFFTFDSFGKISAELVQLLTDSLKYPENKDDRPQKTAQIQPESLGAILAKIHAICVSQSQNSGLKDASDRVMPHLYCGTIDNPLRYSAVPAKMLIAIDFLTSPQPKILLNPAIMLEEQKRITLEDARFFECTNPGLIYQNIYYNFPEFIHRKHLRHLAYLRDITVPEPLFGTFIENSLTEMLRIAEVPNREAIEHFVTLPFTGTLKAQCNISYLNGELEAELLFIYDKIIVPAAPSKLTIDHILPFVTKQGILSRNLVEEQRVIEDIFQDFTFNPSEGTFITKIDKKIVEFMTEVIPKYQSFITFNCPENLLDQFIYDDSTFELHLSETDRIDVYDVDLHVKGHLNGVTMDALWDCLSSRKRFIELARKKSTSKKKGEEFKTQKILVLDLDRLAPIVHVFDEIGIKELTNHHEPRPLWSLANLDIKQFENLPIKFTISNKLLEIQKQMLGEYPLISKPVPKQVKATLRPYQHEGVSWLERLRHMRLNGILADDMGLGKTLQAIIALTQFKLNSPKSVSVVICPTSLVYNWKEEFSKFNPQLKVLPVDGTPSQRKKLLNDLKSYDVVITSYSLLQKDVDFYKTVPFGYLILDEAHHIKNRDTRNAKSVKMLQGEHRLILTGTPIENSLDELWSLFDFLMPGLLSTYDRFVEKYVTSVQRGGQKQLDTLRKKISPFILRRMKKDVIDDLPPVSHIVYHCHLTETQRELYHSYAASAREELSQLVAREGFDKVQIHILATLTRLKQICCHPAIFAKEKAEPGDSAKYDMLMEHLQTLIEGKHKTVIFSQYTRMLQIIRNDLEQQGIPFEYLDGTSKNRLSIVKRFNEDENIPVFLVSLKAGGSGLNLTGADTVIHYDMWWNPAVENQATDRVHRIGQKNSVSAYKLITMNTVEEKIVELQNRKKNLVTQVVASDDETIAKLTWEEVLELLQT